MIYISKNGQQLGPFTDAQIHEGLSQGRFTAFDLAWREGSPQWTPLSVVLGFPPPPPALFQNDPSRQFPCQSKPRVAYILLGLFLGCLGIHNFFAGFAGKGVAQLLITILTGWLIVPLVAVWIWVVVETYGK